MSAPSRPRLKKCLVCYKPTTTGLKVVGSQAQLLTVLQQLTGDPLKVAKHTLGAAPRDFSGIQLCRQCAGHDLEGQPRPTAIPVAAGTVWPKLTASELLVLLQAPEEEANVVEDLPTRSWQPVRRQPKERSLQDEVIARKGRLWDAGLERWVDFGHGAGQGPRMMPTGATVHFDIHNVIGLMATEEFAVQGREVFDVLGVPLTKSRSADEAEETAFEQAFWMLLREQNPKPSPPFPDMWLEALAVDEDEPEDTPGWRQVGMHLTSWPGHSPVLRIRPGGGDTDLGATATVVSALLYTATAAGFPTLLGGFELRLDAEGELVGADWTIGTPAEFLHLTGRGYLDSGPANRFVMFMMRAALLTLSLCNARNIRQVVTRERGKLSRKAKPGDQPLVEVREIRIDGTRRGTVDTSATRGEGRPVRAHLRRAHWRYYGEKYGRGKLFGKYEAAIFQPVSRQGHEALGWVDHRYRVIPRKDARA